MSGVEERIPAQLHETVKYLVEVLRAALGDEIAVVVHGSIALGEYVHGRSDLDVLVIVDEKPQTDALHALAVDLLGLSQQPVPIELSVLALPAVWVHPAPYWFHYSEAWRARLTANLTDPDAVWLATGADPDLTAHLVVARAGGVWVHGQVALPDIARRDAFAAVWYDIADAREQVAANPVYVLLNLCRTIRWLEHGEVLGKTHGGRALLPDLGVETREMVAAALAAREEGTPLEVVPERLLAAVEELLARVERAAAGL